MPHVIVAYAVCGAAGDFLTLRDDGAGGCTFGNTTKVLPGGQFQTCRDLFPGKACASYPGVLTLSFVYSGSTPFIEPAFQNMLDIVGLGRITVLWELDMHIIHAASIPQDLQPAFLPGLTSIPDHLAVRECTSEMGTSGRCTGSDTGEITPDPPVPRRLRSIPAVFNVTKIRDIFIQNPGFRDMTTFKGLRCPPGIMQFLGLGNLRSLSGLEKVQAWTPDVGGPIIVISPSPADISALKTWAHCDDQGLSDLTGAFTSFQSTSCGTLTVGPRLSSHCCKTAFL